MIDEGLVGVTPGLDCHKLYQAYSHGCFPWSGRPARWYCPDPRAVFEFDNIHFSRRLLRTVRQGRYGVTYDRAFRRVVEACVEAHESCWIDDEIVRHYTEFHHQGFAHSIEVWEEEDLVGGLYGVQIHRMFAGESMFSRKRDASKVGFFHLVEKLKNSGVILFDAQVLNPHTRSLGATEIRRTAFLARVRQAVMGEGKGAVAW